jgi:xanthine/uracil permease
MDNASPQPSSKQVSRRRRVSWFLTGTQICVAMIYGTVAVAAYAADGKLSHWSLAAVTLAVCSLLSAAFRKGWLIPCVLLGVLLGFYLAIIKVKGGDHESQRWETVGSVCFWTLLGGFAGVAADTVSRKCRNPENESCKTN